MFEPPAKDYALDQVLAAGLADGSLTRTKARLVTDEIIVPALARRAQAEDIKTHELLQIGNFMTKLGDLDPRTNQVAAGVGGLQVVINMPSTARGPGQVADVLDVTPAPKPLVLNLDPMPAQPEGFKMPDFKLTQDLLGPPLKDAA